MERGLPHTFFTMPAFTFHNPLPGRLNYAFAAAARQLSKLYGSRLAP